MPRAHLTVTALSCLIATSAWGIAEARSKSIVQQREVEVFQEFDGRFMGGQVDPGPFTLADSPVGEGQAPASNAVPASLHGSTIAVYRSGAVVIDPDSGMLVRTDAQGNKVTELAVGPGAAQLVVDDANERLFVTDRTGDRIVVVSLAKGELTQVDAFSTKAEPFGLALSPDGRTLLVTTVADRTLTAFNVGTGMPEWNLELGPEPRGVAISPQGHEAMVTFLTTGAVARVDLSTSTPRMSFMTLDPGTRTASPQVGLHNSFGNGSGGTPSALDPMSDEGKSFARNAFGVAYVGHNIAVVPHQLSTPHLASGDFESEASGYGGGNGFTSPINHRLAFFATPEAGDSGSVRTAMAATNLHQPRALAYDGNSDTLYVAGFGSDNVLAVADVSQASVHASWQHKVADTHGACGPDGLAVDPSNGQVLVYCSLTRRVVRLAGDPATNAAPVLVSHSGELADSRLSAEAQRGRELFRRGNAQEISTFGAMACASCHAETRADGLSWRLQGSNLQTPLLGGRIAGAHPFKWDGKDPDIRSSLTNTVQRLGGFGINVTQADELAAFLESVEPPRAPSVEDPMAVARGKELFESDVTGCASCHYGPLFTDQQQYDLDTNLSDVDTPSLVGLATSAPYYHDGSARTLEALLRGNASIHGMGQIATLTDPQIDDLVQYLETL
ncbi:MAG: c-type cytochrome [Myxococcota bacterium]